jgi:hypothetical protein
MWKEMVVELYKAVPQYSHGGLKTNMESWSGYHSPAADLNPRPPECEME